MGKREFRALRRCCSLSSSAVHSFCRRRRRELRTLFSNASMRLGALAEQQRCDLGQITTPDGEVVQTVSRVKGVSDLVSCQQFRELLVPLERRILPAAADPKQLQLFVGSL